MEKGVKDTGEQQAISIHFPTLDVGLRTAESKVQNLSFYALRFTHYILRVFLTSFVLLWMLLVPAVAAAQMTGGGWTISLYGMVQVEPGNGVTVLKVRDENIRFLIHNIQCSDRNFSTGRFMSDVTTKEPGLYIKGPEEWLDVLLTNGQANVSCKCMEPTIQTRVC